MLDYIYNLHKDDTDAIYRGEKILSEADRLLWTNLTKATDKNTQILDIATKFGVPYFDIVKLVCDDKNKICTTYTDEGYKTFHDYGHFTLEGAKFFGERLSEHGFDELLK